MNYQRNLRIYRLWAPVYDAFFTRVFDRSRRRAVELLDLQPGERLLIPGIGTGLDLPYVPAGVSVVGGDISPEMLDKARSKVDGRDVTLLEMDAQALEFPDASFDAVLLNLILSVVPDGAAAFRQAWRVLKPGGRAVILKVPARGRRTDARPPPAGPRRYGVGHRSQPPPQRDHRWDAGPDHRAG